jgi:4'-phosphopantetheinyl transferase
MIQWLLQAASALPETPEALLSGGETQAYATLTVPKRRADWLLGRITAKQLVQAYLNETGSGPVALDRISIAADADGAPYALLDGERLPISLSISHSHATALCALAAGQGATVGADIEFIEARDPAFTADFFTATEQVAISAAPEALRDLYVTLAWSAKEALLKALREGLRIDTRQIEVTVPAEGRVLDDWLPLEVSLDDALAERYPGECSSWWRRHDGSVLTLALYAPPWSHGGSRDDR